MKSKHVPFEESIRLFSPEELAWDYHCNPDFDTQRLIESEAKARGLNLCRVPQVRHGGPFVPGMRFTRPACNGRCGLKKTRSKG